MASSLDHAKARVDAIFDGYQQAAGMQPRSMISAKAQAGKVYELWILCRLLETLDRKEQFEVELVGGEQLTLRSSPGGIKEKFPHFELHRGGERFDVWTDIEFLTLSHARRGSTAEQYGDYHELDIAIVEHGSRGRPRHDRVVLGVECKDRRFGKDLLRGVLGVRRELSLLAGPKRTRFRSWPRRTVPADPPSCYLVYCSRRNVADYSSPGETFGIDFFHEPPP